MQRFLAKEIALAQNANEFLFLGVSLTNGDAHLSLGYDEECVAASTLTDDVVAFLIECLLQNVRYFDKYVFRLIFEYGNATNQRKGKNQRTNSL